VAILIRPVREQFEHDRVIRELELKLKRRYGVEANVGDDRKAPIKSGGIQLYPDLILTQSDGGKKPHAIVEVETGESVNHLEALGQWARFSKARVQFHLYVPVASVDAALRLCKAHRVSPAEVWAFLPYGDQFRFTQVSPTPGLVEPDLDLVQIRADRRAADEAEEALRASELATEQEAQDEKAAAAPPVRASVRSAPPSPKAAAGALAGRQTAKAPDGKGKRSAAAPTAPARAKAAAKGETARPSRPAEASAAAGKAPAAGKGPTAKAGARPTGKAAVSARPSASPASKAAKAAPKAAPKKGATPAAPQGSAARSGRPPSAKAASTGKAAPRTSATPARSKAPTRAATTKSSAVKAPARKAAGRQTPSRASSAARAANGTGSGARKRR
jgi:hypothetical protein